METDAEQRVGEARPSLERVVFELMEHCCRYGRSADVLEQAVYDAAEAEAQRQSLAVLEYVAVSIGLGADDWLADGRRRVEAGEFAEVKHGNDCGTVEEAWAWVAADCYWKSRGDSPAVRREKAAVRAAFHAVLHSIPAGATLEDYELLVARLDALGAVEPQERPQEEA